MGIEYTSEASSSKNMFITFVQKNIIHNVW